MESSEQSLNLVPQLDTGLEKDRTFPRPKQDVPDWSQLAGSMIDCCETLVTSHTHLKSEIAKTDLQLEKWLKFMEADNEIYDPENPAQNTWENSWQQRFHVKQLREESEPSEKLGDLSDSAAIIRDLEAENEKLRSKLMEAESKISMTESSDSVARAKAKELRIMLSEARERIAMTEPGDSVAWAKIDKFLNFLVAEDDLVAKDTGVQ